MQLGPEEMVQVLRLSESTFEIGSGAMQPSLHVVEPSLQYGLSRNGDWPAAMAKWPGEVGPAVVEN